MAASYWGSTQQKFWTFTRPEIQRMHQELQDVERLLVNQHALPDPRLLNIYFSIQLGKLAKRMSIRQQALATAQVYMRRYYAKVEIRRTNPYLVLSTAFYLACKMEECPQHIRLVAGESRQLWPDVTTSEPSQLGECEFSIISELNSQLLVHHPYRSLTELKENHAQTLSLSLDEMSLAWNIINDHYLTDLPLLHAPYTIAVTAAFLAIVMKPTQGGSMQASSASVAGALGSLGGVGGGSATNRVQKALNWIAESKVDVEAMVDITQELISLYEIWDGYKESLCKEPIAKFVKARGLEK
ncbi:C/H/G cyclin [Microthyrium microscopicum]|uniref:RNA polymerase II holoenzyme cyclin-like subunit n=1 Tax=Microthyrium microscopicum TaxID=703497 RepID=A0A6A6U5F9_9PEZI|nr:C/H/G cyclin [Microthyrium microscopicum]